MAGTSFEYAAQARAALGAIVSEPDQGMAALSSARAMGNLLKDLLPDAPRETAILVASIDHGVPDTLRERISEGMDAPTAVRLTASALAETTVFTPEACDWAVSELAIALGLSAPTDAVAPRAKSPANSTAVSTADLADDQGYSGVRASPIAAADPADHAVSGTRPTVVTGGPGAASGTGGSGGPAPTLRRRGALVYALVGVAIIAVGVTVIAILPAGTGASNHTPRSGTETLVLSSTSAEANPVYALTANGLFSGKGTLPGIGDGLSKSLARLPGGDFVLSHPPKDSSAASSVDPTTCLYTYEQTGSYTISDGTGRFAGITGWGTYVNVYTATLPRKNGKCESSSAAPLPGTVSRMVNGSGPVTLR